MIPRGCQPRASTPISLISIHTAEGATTVAGLAHYLDGAGVEASYHMLVDDNTIVRYLDDSVAAWAMLSGNPRSLQLCFTGFAAWTREQWLSHSKMLQLAAAQVASWSRLYNIPPRKLTPSQVGADWWGICGHWDWTLGKHDGTHTDPGINFPWDTFIALVNGGSDVLQDERDALFDVRAQLAGVGPLGTYPGWEAHPDTSNKPKTLVDYIRALHAEQQEQRATLASIIAHLGVKP